MVKMTSCLTQDSEAIAKDEVQKVLQMTEERRRQWEQAWDEQRSRLEQNLQVCQFYFDLRQVRQRFVIFTPIFALHPDAISCYYYIMLKYKKIRKLFFYGGMVGYKPRLLKKETVGLLFFLDRMLPRSVSVQICICKMYRVGFVTD